MKIIKNKNGMTLLEIILAIAVFVVVVLPLFSIFVQSIKVNRKAEDVLNANYISQDYLEKLDTLTYANALADLPTDESTDGYNFTAKIIPYGNLAKILFSQENCSYVHLIMYEDGSSLCVLPDGKWHKFTTIPTTFSLTLTGGTYSFTGGYTTITGTSIYNYCALMVNAMKKPDAAKSAVTLGGNCKAALYIKEVDSGDITFSGGTSMVYENLNSGDTSLVYVTTVLFDPSKENIIARSDSYINIKNW